MQVSLRRYAFWRLTEAILWQSDESIFCVSDSGMHMQGRDETEVDWENHTMLASKLASSALHAQMPDLKDVVFSTNGGGGAKGFVSRLVGFWGLAALEISNNPALRHVTLVISGAGNDWCYKIMGKPRFYTIDDLPLETSDYYKMLVQYSKAFGSSVWLGLGNAAIYSGKQNGPHYDGYMQMMADLRKTVQGFDVVLTSERNMSSMEKRDVARCACTLRSTLMWCEIA